MCGDILSSDPVKRVIYNISVALFAYIAPLLTIFYSYFRILYVLHKRSDRRTFRFAKCTIITNNYDENQLNHPLRSSTKSLNHKRISNPEQSVVQEEINSHNMKTITRAKFKTLKLTVLIGKKFFKRKKKNNIFIFISSHLFYSLLDTLLLYCLFSSYNRCSY